MLHAAGKIALEMLPAGMLHVQWFLELAMADSPSMWIALKLSLSSLQ